MPIEPARAPRALIKKSMRIAGHRTSIALEPEFWEAVDQIAAERGLTRPKLINEIDGGRAPNGADQSLASAIRVFVLMRYKSS